MPSLQQPNTRKCCWPSSCFTDLCTDTQGSAGLAVCQVPGTPARGTHGSTRSLCSSPVQPSPHSLTVLSPFGGQDKWPQQVAPPQPRGCGPHTTGAHLLSPLTEVHMAQEHGARTFLSPIGQGSAGQGCPRAHSYFNWDRDGGCHSKWLFDPQPWALSQLAPANNPRAFDHAGRHEATLQPIHRNQLPVVNGRTRNDLGGGLSRETMYPETQSATWGGEPWVGCGDNDLSLGSIHSHAPLACRAPRPPLRGLSTRPGTPQGVPIDAWRAPHNLLIQIRCQPGPSHPHRVPLLKATQKPLASAHTQVLQISASSCGSSKPDVQKPPCSTVLPAQPCSSPYLQDYIWTARRLPKTATALRPMPTTHPSCTLS